MATASPEQTSKKIDAHADARVSTGCAGLDNILNGGFPRAVFIWSKGTRRGKDHFSSAIYAGRRKQGRARSVHHAVGIAR